MEKCFGNRKGKCMILEISKCSGTGCCFYKSDEEFRDGQRKSMNRIKSLGSQRRKYIMKKYHSRRRRYAL